MTRLPRARPPAAATPPQRDDPPHAARGEADAGAPLARIEILAPVSIVVPTFRERENLPNLLGRLDALRRAHRLDLELLVMDDDSRDGSAEFVAESGHDWARLVTRTADRGLSPAVVDGLCRAKNPVVICMDADLSHPPEKIPDMVLALESGQQFVIGSRYVPGGSTDDDWGIFRWLNSRVATLLAWPLTNAKDPMSGFFALRKSDFERGVHSLNPIGYKIALELIVKCGVENVGEVPIHFTDRVLGQSKLDFKEQLRYVQHLRRLYIHKFGTAMDFLQFLAVGASGLVVNLLVLTLLLAAGAPGWLALAGGIGVSLVSNFLLNRRFTFSYARNGNSWTQLAGFLGASAVGMCVNYAVSLTLLKTSLHDVRLGVQLAAIVGVAAGMLFNFVGNRFVVFKRRYTTEPKGA